MTILQQPDALSFSMNLKPFKINTAVDVAFTLRQGGETLLTDSLSPDADDMVELSLRDVIHDRLSCAVPPDGNPYVQPAVAADFTAVFGSQSVSFRVIRGGVDGLSETVPNFVRANFLTWQPNVKPVTYSSPEFLSYYAVDSGCSLKVKAYFTDTLGNVTPGAEKTICSLTQGVVTTVSVQYAVIAGLYSNSLPAYYDVWVDSGSTALTYIQRYYADALRSEEEQWFFFENSLGGIDTFRAFGAVNLDSMHTHNIAEIDDVSYEYRVDTERKWSVNTGHIDMRERRWLLDFFPSAGKYIYTDLAVRRIVLVDDSVAYRFSESPSSYAFTFRYADALPLLNLPRHELPVEMLDITVPDVGSFTLPPRLLEFTRQPLSEGVLFPVQSPYSEEWAVTSLGGIADYVRSLIHIPSPGLNRAELFQVLGGTPRAGERINPAFIDLSEFLTGSALGRYATLADLIRSVDGKLDTEFFASVFTVYDEDGNPIVPNTYEQAANNLQAMVGLWTEKYLSALGRNDEEGEGGGTGILDLQQLWEELGSSPWTDKVISDIHIPQLGISKIEGLHDALNTFALKVRKIQTGNGLHGGGDLQADRTLSVKLRTVSSSTDNSGLKFTTDGSLYVDVVDSLTSTNQYRPLSAKQGKLLADRIEVLESMFEVDANGDVKTRDYIVNGVTKKRGLYSESFVSALGANGDTSGGGTGVELSAVWQSLTTNTDEYGTSKIHIDHIPNLSNLTLSYGKSGAVTSSVVYNGKAVKTVYIPQKLSDLSDGANVVTDVAYDGTKGFAKTINGSTTSIATGITKKYVLAAPSSANGVPLFRALLLSDISDASDLQAIEALTGTSGILKKTAANTWTLDTNSYAKTDGSNATGTWGISISGNAASSTGLASTTMPSGANYDDYRSFTDCRIYDNGSSLEDIPNIGKYSTLVSMGKYMRTFQIRADHYSTFLAYRVLQDNGEGSPQRFVFTDWRQILHSDYAILNNNVTLRWKDNGGTDLNCLNLSANNELGIGYETSAQGYSTYIDGAAIYLRYGAEHVTGLSIAGSGAVTIANVLSANGGIVVPASKSIKIGTIVLEDDNGLLKVWDGTGNAVKGIYATGTVSALGANTSGGGGTGIEMPQVWEALAQAGNNEPINYTHLQAALTSNGYMHSFSKTNPTGANVVTDVNYNSSTGTLSVTRGSLAMKALAPRDIPSTLATFYDGDNLIYTRAGGNNTVADKPQNVTAFGVITMRTAGGYYGQILYGANGHIYYRSAETANLEGTAWNTLLGTLNYKSYTYDKTATYNRNMVLASSASADGNAATFRALVADDIPSLPANKIGSGTFDKARIPDLSSLYVPISAKWWGQSISDGAVSGNMTGVGSIIPVTNSYPDIGTRENYFGNVYGVSLTLADTTSNEDMYFGWRDVTINDVSERVFTMYAYQTRYSDILLGQSGASPGGGIFYDVSENRVGIGTYTPQRTLDIAGTLGVSGRLYANGKITVTHEGGTGTGNELIVLSVGENATYNCISYEKSSGWTNGYNWSSGINADGYYLWNAANGGTQQLVVTNDGQTQVKSLKIGTITLTDDNGLLRIDKGVYSLGTVSALGANSQGGGGGADIADVWDALARPDSSKLIDSSHINITTSGEGNAFTGITKSGTSITLNKGISFLPLTGNNAANTPVTGDVNFDNGISLKWKKSSGSTAYSVLCLDGSNQLMLGLATAGQSCDTKIYGNNIYLNYGVSGTTGITLASGGNVTIANNLTVSGTSTLTGAVTASSTITATGAITGGSIVKKNGTSTQFLKADGSIDERTYLQASDNNLFSTLSSTSATNLTVKVGDTTKTITSLYANYLNGNPWHWYMKRGSVYTGNVSGARWMKAASFEAKNTPFTSSHYSEIVLAVNDFTSSEQVGILSVCYGREPNATAPNTTYVYAKWIVKTKAIDTNRFVLAYDFSYTSSTATSRAYLYVKMTGVWQQFSFTKISETGWNGNANIWVLNTGDTTSAYSYTDIPEANQVVSSDITYASNAGMLNGVAASGYVTIAGTQKITGVKTFDVDKLEVLGGEVAENVNKSTIKFKTFANNTYYRYDNSGVVNTSSAIRNSILFDWYDTAWVIGNIRGVGTDSYGFGFGCRFSNNGNVLDRFHITTVGDAYVATSLYAGSEVTASSDERLKDVVNVTTLTVNDIADAPSIKYLWKDKRDEKVHIGSIAQYWEKALPEAVSYDENGMMSLNYGALALVSAITIARGLMKHEDEITKLKRENEELKERISALERRAA